MISEDAVLTDIFMTLRPLIVHMTMEELIPRHLTASLVAGRMPPHAA